MKTHTRAKHVLSDQGKKIVTKAKPDQQTKDERLAKQLTSKPGLGRKLTELEKTAILADLENRVPWKEIAETYQISGSTICRLRNEYLQTSAATDLIKKIRLDKLYEVSEWVLDSIRPEEIAKANLSLKNKLLGTLEDKIAQREGRTGNVQAIMVHLGNMAD